jgi:hypothetical protein
MLLVKGNKNVFRSSLNTSHDILYFAVLVVPSYAAFCSSLLLLSLDRTKDTCLLDAFGPSFYQDPLPSYRKPNTIARNGSLEIELVGSLGYVLEPCCRFYYSHWAAQSQRLKSERHDLPVVCIP